MTDRKRDQLPAWYQYGDAGKSMPLSVEDYWKRYDEVRPRIGDTIRVRLPRLNVHVGGWNVIEGEKH